MKAGKTNFEVNTRVIIIDSDDKDLIGVTGTITHPFMWLMRPRYSGYVAGLWIDEEYKGVYENNQCNLTLNDLIKEIS